MHGDCKASTVSKSLSKTTVKCTPTASLLQYQNQSQARSKMLIAQLDFLSPKADKEENINMIYMSKRHQS